MVLVGASVYLNWRYAGNVAETDKILGQATLVNENGEGVTVAGDDILDVLLGEHDALDVWMDLLHGSAPL